MQARPIRIGTRGSALALAQANEVRARIMAAHGLGDDALEIVIIKTTGDMVLDRPLAEIGGKGLFTKEIEDALLSNEIDLAVHSMKDVQTVLPPGLGIVATLPREDVRDAFISLKYASLDDVPAGTVVGTSSLRRQAQLKRRRPDLEIVGFRGNVQTRLTKLRDNVADATFLACAGLKRLGLAAQITAPVPTDVMLPAVAQGAIGIEARLDDTRTRDILVPLEHADSATCVIAERAFLARLEGSCRTPIAALAELVDGAIRVRGQTLSPDGVHAFECDLVADRADAERLGTAVADDIIGRGGRTIMTG
ncbi:MAG: hydroxymethylbilane synthase [Hyphomicrobium sp.]|nr:hydroxymethylbilane synthase [Hyphomicrobium sp.]